MLQFAIDQKVQLIPVIVQNEQERYHVVSPTHPILGPIQRWCARRLDYPLPLVYWWRLFNATRPPPILVQFGSIMASDIYPDVTALRAALVEFVRRAAVPGDKDIKGN